MITRKTSLSPPEPVEIWDVEGFVQFLQERRKRTSSTRNPNESGERKEKPSTEINVSLTMGPDVRSGRIITRIIVKDESGNSSAPVSISWPYVDTTMTSYIKIPLSGEN